MHDWTKVGPIWLIGCGNMAGAMLRRWLEVGLPSAAVTVVRPSGTPPAAGVRTLTAMPVGAPRVLMLGVKPQMLDVVAPTFSAAAGPDTLLISILAGTELAALRNRFPHAGAIVRAMPNLPVAIGRGVVALHGEPGLHDAELNQLMEPLGLVEWMADESLFGAAAALTASGPAFVYRFIEALAEGGAAMGLPTDQALRFATAMVDGAAGLALDASDPPDALASQVASRGGMTRAGLDVLDQGEALRDLLREALIAAQRRERELAAASR